MKKDEAKFSFSMYSISGNDRLVSARAHNSAIEFIEVLKGEVAVQIGIELVRAVEGDFIYIPSEMLFSVEAVSEYASVRGMIFDRSVIHTSMEKFDTEIFYMFDLQSRNKINLFKKGHPAYETLSRYMQESYDEYVSKDVCYKLPIRANIYLMMTSLLRFYCGSKDEDDRIVYHNVLRLRPVIEYIYSSFSEKIYIEKLSDMISVSPDYFTKMFKETIGTTPIEYINGLRVNKAMRLLVETQSPMADIATAAGFSTPNYFNKIFKQYMGVSPLSYKKKTR